MRRVINNHGVRRAMCTLAFVAVTQVLPESAIALDRLLELALIKIKPLVATACQSASKSTDTANLEQIRHTLLDLLADLEKEHQRLAREAQQVDEQLIVVGSVYDDLVDQVSKFESLQQTAVLSPNEKKSLDGMVTSSRRSMKDQKEKFDAAIDKDGEIMLDLSAVEYELATGKPAYDNAIACVEIRLAALRREAAPPPTTSASVCRLEAGPWETGKANFLTIVAKSGEACQQDLNAGGRVRLRRGAIFPVPSNGTARLDLLNLTYQSKAGFRGTDKFGLMVETMDGDKVTATSLVVTVQVQ